MHHNELRFAATSDLHASAIFVAGETWFFASLLLELEGECYGRSEVL